MITIQVSRKRPINTSASPEPAPEAVVAEAPPQLAPPVPAEEPVQPEPSAAVTAVSQPPAPPTDDTASLNDGVDTDVLRSLAVVGIPAGLFTNGSVVPAHAADVLADHAQTLGLDPSEVARLVTSSLVGLHIMKATDAARVMSSIATAPREPASAGDTAADAPSPSNTEV